MPSDSAKALLQTLTQELLQAETSAAKHCRREGNRYGDAPPAQALRAVADHAEEVLKHLPSLATHESLPLSKFGTLAGSLLSELRDKVLDRVIQTERSYRGTLLGIRHGVDLVLSLRHAAEAVGNERIFDFCESWLVQRSVLMERVEEELVWFSRHPDAAVQGVGSLVLREAASTAPSSP